MNEIYRKIQVIVNPAAGQDEAVLSVLNRVFREHEVQWDVSITHEAGDGAKLARQAVESGADLVAIYGGDGSVLEAANGMAGSSVPLAVLPGGTANAFASEIGVPKNLQEAAELIFDSQVRAIDLGRANDGYFVMRVDMGLSSRITQDADREMKDKYGILAYAIAALNAVTKAEPIRYRMVLDGQTVETEGVACLVANVSDLGAFNLTLDKRVDPGDGLLDVFVAASVRESLLSMAADVLNLQEGAASNFQRWQTREVTIEADPPQPVYADGDEFSHTPISIQVAPGALKVLVAREAEEKEEKA